MDMFAGISHLAHLAAWKSDRLGSRSYEGEGTVTRCGGYLRLSIRMTTEEPVRRFQAVVNCGTVYGPYQNGPGRKPVWMWVGVGEDALDVADLLRPWLSAPRRAQLVRVFRADV
jgi:hypothetical protein